MRKITLASIEDNIGSILKMERLEENIVIVLVSHGSGFASILFDDDCGEMVNRTNYKDLISARKRYQFLLDGQRAMTNEVKKSFRL